MAAVHGAQASYRVRVARAQLFDVLAVEALCCFDSKNFPRKCFLLLNVDASTQVKNARDRALVLRWSFC